MATSPCPACGNPVSPQAHSCPSCGQPFARPPQDDAMATVVPYRNPSALVAYYCAVFSLIPCLGVILGPVALICGFVGLGHRRRNPSAKGAAHAWVGIILGGLTTLANVGGIAVLFARAGGR